MHMVFYCILRVKEARTLSCGESPDAGYFPLFFWTKSEGEQP